MSALCNGNTSQKGKVHVGYDFSSSGVLNLEEAMNSLTETGYSCFFVSITNASNQPVHNGNMFSGMLDLKDREYSESVIGITSENLNVDCEDKNLRQRNATLLQHEILFCKYFNLNGVVFRLPASGNMYNLARIIHSSLKSKVSFMPYHIIKVPMVSASCINSSYQGKTVPNDAWRRWNHFRSSIGGVEKYLKVALELPKNLPEEKHINCWFGESIFCLIINADVFLTNAKGYPVLSVAHQAVVKKFLLLRVQIVISGRMQLMHEYQAYINHLWLKVDEDPVMSFARGYEDYIQTPLQPLANNLDNTTYSTFEKDPVKYVKYEEAITRALLDKKTTISSEPLVLMVLGAGRGPLVNAALRASEKSEVKIKLYAIEKNKFAGFSLNRQKNTWEDRVTLVFEDMRSWNTPEKADIIISELLGSFGDNELSPECLDGAQRLLKDDGISIPCSYSSYIEPIQSFKVYESLKDTLPGHRDHDQLEQPYVVYLQAISRLATIQKLFTFVHPNKDSKIDNTRQKELSFEIKFDSVLHGFAGYFDAVLYKDITMSIVPETHTNGMFSWFPMFFPIKDPIQLKENETLKLVFWRLASPTKVWYEWLVEEPVSVSIHNSCGESYSNSLISV